MSALAQYRDPATLPATVAGRIGRILGLDAYEVAGDVALADRISQGLRADAADRLAAILGRGAVIGPLIPEATLRRARTGRKPLSREMSERLYEVSRVIDVASRIYHGDEAAVSRFLNRPHRLLAGRTPLELARSSSAGADAVINLTKRAEAGFPV